MTNNRGYGRPCAASGQHIRVAATFGGLEQYPIKKPGPEDQNRAFGRCGAKRSRTADLLNAIQALYQLSYSPIAMRYAEERETRSEP